MEEKVLVEGQDARKLSVPTIHQAYKNQLFRNVEPEMAAAEKRESPFDNRGSFKRKQQRRRLLLSHGEHSFSTSVDSVDADVFLANPEPSESKLLGFPKPRPGKAFSKGSSAERIVKARIAQQEIEMGEKVSLGTEAGNYGAVGGPGDQTSQVFVNEMVVLYACWP
jgi:hypothetical protein